MDTINKHRKTISLISVYILLFHLNLGSCKLEKIASKPNVIIIVADDMVNMNMSDNLAQNITGGTSGRFLKV